MKGGATPLKQSEGRERDRVQPPLTTESREEMSDAECAALDLGTASQLLRKREYGLRCRFGHVHAAQGRQEWHVCLLADLDSMFPSRLLTCLDEALALRVEQRMVLLPQTEEVRR